MLQKFAIFPAKQLAISKQVTPLVVNCMRGCGKTSISARDVTRTFINPLSLDIRAPRVIHGEFPSQRHGNLPGDIR